MAAPSDPNQPVLRTEGIVKTYPGVRALDGVDFDLRRGEVHALVGENGAGKSTLMHVLGGVIQPEEGTIFLDGEPVAPPDPHAAARLGISVVFQELSLSGNLSIAENILANRQPVGFLNLVDWDRLHAETAEMLRLFEIDRDPRTPVERLGAAEQQVVEILKALSLNPKVLIFDEPTSSLTSHETELLFRNIQKIRSEGTSCIYISHHLPEVFEIADRVTILRDGAVVDTLPVADVTEDDLIRLMVGRELVDMFGSPTGDFGDECFRLEHASSTEVPGGGSEPSDISFAIREGEILGVAGLAGAGRTEIGRGIFGLEPFETGEMFLHGESLRVRSPEQAIRHGIAYLTEDRKEQGLFLRMDVRANCAAASLDRFTSGSGFLDETAITRSAEEHRSRFGIATPSVRQTVENLSGGNQQKVLLAMWIGTKPKLLIADEPTRGVDVGARSEIYHFLRELAASGVAIIMISSDLPEILGMSDRILVVRNGAIAGEFARNEATEEGIIACAAGVATVGTETSR